MPTTEARPRKPEKARRAHPATKATAMIGKRDMRLNEEDEEAPFSKEPERERGEEDAGSSREAALRRWRIVEVGEGAEVGWG